MKQVKYLIVDDEPLAREGIKLNADHFDHLLYGGECYNAIQTLNFLNTNHDIDLIFLDIEMPGMTGLEFLRSTTYKGSVILTTAYPQYALESYEYGVIDYLVKPIRLERFTQAIMKVNAKQQLSISQGQSLQKKETDFIFVKSERSMIKVYYNDILYISGLKDYVAIQTHDKKILTALNIKTINKQLPQDHFCRINKSYIVNVHKIDRIAKSDVLVGDQEIAIGDTYKEEFLNRHIINNILKR